MSANARTINVKVYIYQCDYGYGEPTFVAFNSPAMGDKWNTLVGPAEFTYTVAHDWNPTAAKVAALEKEREEVTRKFTETLGAINRRLSELQAITYQTEAA